MIAAAPADLERYIGAEALAFVQRVLESLPDETPDSEFAKDRIVHGARLDPPAAPQPPRVDLALRDRLFAELRKLQQSNDERSRERARELEARLDALLEG